MSRRIRVRQLEGRDSMFISGWTARQLIVIAGGKPQWSRRRAAWMTNVRIGSDVIALAEHDGISVTFERVGDDDER